MVPLVPLAVEGVTVLSVRQMITLHVYLGILLVGPVLLKTASTTYRFARYYTGAPVPRERATEPNPAGARGGGDPLQPRRARHRYRARRRRTGAPGTVAHPAPGQLHRVVAAMSPHVLGHVVEASRTTWRELRDPRAEPAARRLRARTLAIVTCPVAGRPRNRAATRSPQLDPPSAMTEWSTPPGAATRRGRAPHHTAAAARHPLRSNLGRAARSIITRLATTPDSGVPKPLQVPARS